MFFVFDCLYISILFRLLISIFKVLRQESLSILLNLVLFILRLIVKSYELSQPLMCNKKIHVQFVRGSIRTRPRILLRVIYIFLILKFYYFWILTSRLQGGIFVLFSFFIHPPYLSRFQSLYLFSFCYLLLLFWFLSMYWSSI